jgi:hypothetical protein
MALDYISVTLTCVMWREEHLWNIAVFVGRGSY